MTTRKAATKTTGDDVKKEVNTIDLNGYLDAANAALPDGVELEIVSIAKGGKRIDLVRGDTVTRMVRNLRTVDVKHVLIGIAQGRAIE